MRILLVEDDRDLSEFMQEGLAREGFVVELAQNGKEAVLKADESHYDVILLDIMMPQMDGYAVLKTLRSKGNKAAVLVVTCKGQERDKLQGLNSGADDYIVKPFLLTELIARIRAVVRRTGQTSQKAPQGSIMKLGDIQLDVLKREVKRGGKVIELTKKEFDLLEYFMQRPGQVLSQTVIAQHISSTDFNTTTNTIEVHVKNLRTKLDGKSSKSLIRTVRGCGYALDV